MSDGTAWINTVPEVNTIIAEPNAKVIYLDPSESSFSLLWTFTVNTLRTITDNNLIVVQNTIAGLTPSLDNVGTNKTVYNGLEITLNEAAISYTNPTATSLNVVNNSNTFSFQTVIEYTLTASGFNSSSALAITFLDANSSLISHTLRNTTFYVGVANSGADFLDIKTEATLTRLLSLTTVERDSVVLGANDEGKVIFNKTAGAIQVWDGSAWF